MSNAVLRMDRSGDMVCRHAFLIGCVALFVGLMAPAMPAPHEGVPLPAPAPRPNIHAAQDADNPGERFAAARALRPQTLTEEYKLNFLRELARQKARFPNQIAGANYPQGIPLWRSIGPRTAKYEWNGVPIEGIDSGRIRTVLTDPSDSDHVYVLTAGGGLWVTTDFSTPHPKWRVLTDGLLSTSGGSVAFGRDTRTLYVGIGDPFEANSSIAGVMVKSTDGGVTWSAFISLQGAFQVRDVKVDTSGREDVVLVATDVGVFRSTDSGASYALTSLGQADGNSSAWNIVRSRQGWLVNSVEPGFDPDGRAYLGSGTGELYTSADRGATWNRIPSVGDVFTTIGRATLAVARPGDLVVYAIASTSGGFAQSDVYRSTNGGLSWTALHMTGNAPTNPNCFQPDLNILGDQAYYNQLIVVSPSDPKRNTVYIGGNLSNAKTSDGGTSWTLLSSWLPTACDLVSPQLPYVHADSHTARIDVVGGVDRIVFGTDGGIFVSQDGGSSFDSTKNVGIVALLAQTISSTPQRDDSVITGAQDDGTRARIGASQTWNQVFGGDGEGVAWSQSKNAATIVSAEFMEIATQKGLSANTGNPNNWQDGTVGIDFDDPDCFPFFTPMATPTAKADPTGLVFYTATGSRLYKTVDGANHWISIMQRGTVDNPTCDLQEEWRVVGLHPTDPNRIALALYGGHVLVTTDGGTTWTSKRVTDTIPEITAGTFGPAWAVDPLTLYLTVNSTPGIPHVVKSTDGGSTWTLANIGLPDIPVWDLAVDAHDRFGRTVYAGTDLGVYVTHDGGASWALFGAGLPVVSVQGLYLSPTDDFLRVATYGRGVWEIDTGH